MVAAAAAFHDQREHLAALNAKGGVTPASTTAGGATQPSSPHPAEGTAPHQRELPLLAGITTIDRVRSQGSAPNILLGSQAHHAPASPTSGLARRVESPLVRERRPASAAAAFADANRLGEAAPVRPQRQSSKLPLEGIAAASAAMAAALASNSPVGSPPIRARRASFAGTAPITNEKGRTPPPSLPPSQPPPSPPSSRPGSAQIDHNNSPAVSAAEASKLPVPRRQSVDVGALRHHSASPIRHATTMTAANIAVHNADTPTSHSPFPSSPLPISQTPQPGAFVPATQRRSGAVTVKHVLAATKKLQLVQAAKRNWIPFWTVLRGPMLCFYATREACVANEVPQRQLVVEGCLALPAEEPMKRSHVLMLALPAGDLFYMQAESDEACQAWAKELHLSALVADAMTTESQGLERYLAQHLKQLERQLKVETDHKRVTQVQLAAGECEVLQEEAVVALKCCWPRLPACAIFHPRCPFAKNSPLLRNGCFDSRDLGSTN